VFVDVPTCICGTSFYWVIWATDFCNFLTCNLPKNNVIITKNDIEKAFGGGEDD